MEDSKESRLRAEFFVRLADSDWVNIVNHPDVLDRPDGDTELAVACAVRLTERRLRELNAAASASRSEILEALKQYVAAVRLMNTAMRDGVNVHGALSGFVAAEDSARALLAKYQGE